MYNYIKNKINQYNNKTETPISGELLKLATPSAVTAGGLVASYLANGLLPGSDVDPATTALGFGAAFGTPSGSLYSRVGKLALGGEIAKTALNDALGTDYQTPGIVPMGLLAGGLANKYGRRWFDPANTRNAQAVDAPKSVGMPDAEDMDYGISTPTTSDLTVKVTPDAWDMSVNVSAPKNSAPPIVSSALLGTSRVVQPNPSKVVQDVIDTPTINTSPIGSAYGLSPEQERNLMTNLANARNLNPKKVKILLDKDDNRGDGTAFVKLMSQRMSSETAGNLRFPSEMRDKGQPFEGKELYNPLNLPIHQNYKPTPAVLQSPVVAIGNLTPNTKKKSWLVQTGHMDDGSLFPTVWGLGTDEVVSGNIPIGVFRNTDQLSKIANKIMNTPK